MKYILLTLVLLFSFNLICSADSDIAQQEVMPDVAVWKLDTVRFLVFTKTCEVTYRKGYMDGEEFVGINHKDVTIIFQDIEDNPETPQDETKTEFSDLINYINNHNNLKNSITNAVKIKLGL